MVVLFQLPAHLLLRPQRVLLVLLVDVVDLSNCPQVACPHAHLLGFCALLALRLLLVELLEFLPEFVGLLFLELAVFALLVLEPFVDFLEVLLVGLCVFGLLGRNFLLILDYFVGCGHNLLFECGPAHLILGLLPPK